MNTLLNAHHRHPRLSRARRIGRGGFTLVEILVVVLILGIASAIIAPQIGSRNDLKVRAAARLLVSDLIYAQNLAIAEQRTIFVRFDEANENYRLMDAPSGTDRDIVHPITKDQEFVTRFGPAAGSKIPEVRIKSAVFNGVDLSYRPEFTLAFDPLGTPFVYCYDNTNTNEMLDGTVVLECGTDTISVIVEPYTGEIKIP